MPGLVVRVRLGERCPGCGIRAPADGSFLGWDHGDPCPAEVGCFWCGHTVRLSGAVPSDDGTKFACRPCFHRVEEQTRGGGLGPGPFFAGPQRCPTCEAVFVTGEVLSVHSGGTHK